MSGKSSKATEPLSGAMSMTAPGPAPKQTDPPPSGPGPVENGSRKAPGPRRRFAGLDPELQAMADVDAILGKLAEVDEESPFRVLAWINDRWELDSHSPYDNTNRPFEPRVPSSEP